MTYENLSRPNRVAVDKDGNILVSEYSSDSLFKFSREGKFVKVVGRKGTQPGEFNDPSFMKIINDKLYVCDRGNNRFQVLNTKLECVNSFGCHGNGNAEFNHPNDISQDRAGNLYVSDTDNNRVQVFDCNGQFLFAFSEKGASQRLSRPFGICVHSNLVYVCDRGSDSGEFVTSFGHFAVPAGIVIDLDGFVYVGESVPEGRVDIF